MDSLAEDVMEDIACDILDVQTKLAADAEEIAGKAKEVTEWSESQIALPEDVQEPDASAGETPRSTDIQSIAGAVVATMNPEAGISSQGNNRPRTTDSEYDTDFENEDEFPSYDISGRRVYTETCERLGVVPSSYFLRHMQDEVLNMSHHGLGPTGTIALCAPLQSNTFVTDLILADNFMGGDGTAAICWMLQENVYVTSLDLSGNRLRGRGARFIARTIYQTVTLQDLDLTNNEFSDKDGAVLADSITDNKSLTKLNLSRNMLGGNSALAIQAALVENDTLLDLNLSWNFIRYKAFFPICKALKVNTTLKILDLSFNGLSKEGAKALTDVLMENATLEELNVNSCRLGPEGAAYFGKTLAMNNVLQVLKMSNNNVGNASAITLVTCLFKNSKSGLKILDLGKMEVSKDYVKAETSLLEAENRTIEIKRGKVLSDFDIKGVYVRERRIFGLKIPEFEAACPLTAMRDFASEHNIEEFDEYVDNLVKRGISTVDKEEVSELARAPEFCLTEEQHNTLDMRLTSLVISQNLLDVSPLKVAKL